MGLLLSPDHTAALTDFATWRDNPFINRDLRREVKQRQPFISFCWMCGVLLTVCGYAASLWFAAQNTPSTPLFIGGDIGTNITLLISGIQIYFIVSASRTRTRKMFTLESNQNTLSSLLLLPATPFQILLQAMAHPWFAAMRLAVSLLPIYVFCVGIDGPSWLEIFMLYVVFAMAALSTPFWQRPALSENVGILATPKQTAIAKKQQARVGQSAVMDSVAISGALAYRLMLIPAILIFIVMWRMGRLANAEQALHIYLPHSIVDLLYRFPITWPMLFARLLITPLDWFGFSIMPLFFVIPIFLMQRYLELVQASEYLSIGALRDLPLQSTYLPRLRWLFILRFVRTLAIVGYLWRWAVVDGGIRSAGPPVHSYAPGIAAFATMVLLFCGFWGFVRAHILGQRLFQPLVRGERLVLARCSALEIIRFLVAPSAYGLLFYLLCCLLSHANPFPATGAPSGTLAVLFWQAWLIGVTGAFLSFGVTRLMGPANWLFRLGVPALFWIGGACVSAPDIRQWIAQLPQSIHLLDIISQLRHLELFSPFIGMTRLLGGSMGSLYATTPGQVLPAPAWWIWAALALGIGPACWLLGYLLIRRRADRQDDKVTLVFNPTRVGREVFNDPVQAKREGIGQVDTPFVRGLVAKVQSVWDNGVVTRELRTRLRGKLTNQALIAAGCIMAALTLACFHPNLQGFPQIFGGWLAALLMGPAAPGIPSVIAGILGVIYLALFISAFCCSFATNGAFNAETQKSTLGFLLATPLPTNSVVLGKMLGILGPSILFLGTLSGWALVITLLALPMLGPAALLAWGCAITIALSFYLMLNSIGMAVSAMFPTLTMNGIAWVWILIFFFGFFGPHLWITTLVSAILYAIGMRGAGIWLGIVGIDWLVILICYMVARSSIHSMRHRDMVFAANKRAN